MPTLVKLSSNWADEMDIDGFLITLDSKEIVIAKMKNIYMQQTIESVSISLLDLEPKYSTEYQKAKSAYKAYTLNISKEVESMLLDQSLERCIGTNEDLYFDNFDHYLLQHTIEEISDIEYEIIKKRFGLEYGHSPNLSNYSSLTINVI